MGSRTLVLGLIGCRLFEDEVVHVISGDQDVDQVVVVDDDESKAFQNKLKAASPVRIIKVKEDSISQLSFPSGYTVLVWLKPMALHQKPEKLREDIVGTLSRVGEKCDSVLLFYGLCGNAFRHFEKDAGSSPVPVVILRDAKGQIVDDCIGCVLGGTDEYLDQLKKSSGTFFLTPMWAANWRELFNKVQILADPNDIQGAKYVFKCVGYKKVVKMDTGLGDEEEFDRQVDEFSQLFEFEKGTVKCTLDVVEQSYLKAKTSAP
ncbi:MAG: DUF1638 domain-containing protein [Methanomassiliicoccales archaeon]|nr:DUF1638 domain-containing protein [Methanomassiliicoccales archaeon]